MSNLFILVKCLAIFSFLFTLSLPASGADDAMPAALAARIEDLIEMPGATTRGISLQGASLFADFCARRDMQPAWARPGQVLILYLTASVERDGRPRFPKGIYSRDAKLLEALNVAPQMDVPADG